MAFGFDLTVNRSLYDISEKFLRKQTNDLDSAPLVDQGWGRQVEVPLYAQPTGVGVIQPQL